ncbi:MAG: SBBP repeat-containing protein [Bacteroidetes bacterium]|nr:SBBP repeat-containing protein [Bacteroidota bacterium]
MSTSSPTDYNDAFVLKLNSAGNFIWASQIGGLDYDEGTAIAVDAGGNVYTTGMFTFADFDPGPGFYFLNGFGFYYVSKLNSAGNFVWAKQFGNFSSFSYNNRITVDATGNPYIAGNFREPLILTLIMLQHLTLHRVVLKTCLY